MGALSGLSGLSGISGIAGELPPSPDLPYTAGLLADYRLDDGSGTQVTDYSGNGNHGTLVDRFSQGLPTWGPTGLTLSLHNGFDTPLDITQIKTVVVLASLEPNGSGWHTIASSRTTDGTGLMWTYSNWDAFPIGSTQFGPQIGQAGTTRSTARHYNRCTIFTQDGIADTIYQGGVATATATGGYNARGNTASTGRTGALRVGMPPEHWYASGVYGLKGVLRRICFFSGALTDSPASLVSNSIEAWEATRGAITYSNPATNRLLVCEGDSHLTDIGSNPPYTAPSLMTLANTFDRSNFAVSGQSIQTIASMVGMRSLPLLAAPSSPKVVYLLDSIENDVVAGRTPAQIIADHQTVVNAALAKGSNVRVVIMPMMSWTGHDTDKNTINALFAATTWPANVRLILPSELPNVCNDGASTGANFVDGLHNSVAGNVYKAGIVGPIIDTLG